MNEIASPGALPKTLTLNGVTVDFANETLRDENATEIQLRKQSFMVLRHLAENSGRTVSKSELNDAVWAGIAVTDDSLVQCVGDVRRALRDDAQLLIRTEPKRGYRLTLPDATGKATTPTVFAGRSRAGLTLAGIVAVIGLVAFLLWPVSAPPSNGVEPTIAVLRFVDMSGDGSATYLGDGVAEDITTALASFPV